MTIYIFIRVQIECRYILREACVILGGVVYCIHNYVSLSVCLSEGLDVLLELWVLFINTGSRPLGLHIEVHQTEGV